MSDASTPVADRRRTLRLVVLFTVLVLAVAFVAPSLGGDARRPGPGFLLWGLAPMLVALALRIGTRDWSDAGMRPGLRRNGRWYLLSVLVYPVVLGLGLLVSVATGAATVVGFEPGRYFTLVWVALAGLFIPAFFEEFGWRGYLAPKLTALGANPYLGSVLLGAVWATWHLPFVSGINWMFLNEDLATLIPRFYLICIASSVVFGEIRTATGTFWPAALMHAAGNAFGHLLALDYVRITPGREWLGSVGNSVTVIAGLTVIGIGLVRWRTHRTAPAYSGSVGIGSG